MSVILNPVEQYFDLDGEPLQSGYIYFGEVYGNPVTQPTMVYFDPEFTIPAAQPVRTVNGFPVRSGTATGLYAPDDVSILVQNSKREQVIYIQSSAINTGDTTTVYRTSNAALTADDNNRTFIALSAFTQTFDPAVNLGDRWRVNIVNMSGGNLILDPNLAETIDGQASLTLTANQSITVYCNGVNLFTNLVSIKLVPDDPYSESGWNGNTSVPTKNAVRDKIESLNIAGNGTAAKVVRQDASTEGGQLEFAQSSDNKPAYHIDVLGNGVNAQFRLVNRNLNNSGVAAPAMYLDSASALWMVIPGGSTPYPSYGCRVWVNFNGTLSSPISPRGSGNVSSITKHGTGEYTVNFIVSLPDTNYAAIPSAGNGSSSAPGNALVAWPAVYNTGSVRIGVSDNNSDANQDALNVNVSVFR